MTLRFGLAANRRHHEHAGSALLQWASGCATQLTGLDIKFIAVGRTCDALMTGLGPCMEPYLERYPYGRDGGLMRLVSLVAGGTENSVPIDGVIYLIDPVDASSTFPEALALKRQCVTHRKPFISTLAGAREWIEVERIHAGLEPDTQTHMLTGIDNQVVAMIAHDALKAAMLDFADAHFDVLSRFSRRVATGTTGHQLNDLAWSRGWPKGEVWVDRYKSGPLGGDAQIAELVLDRRCQRVLFFEDPHVARQHEADIQLLERAVCTVGEYAICANTPEMAHRWVTAAERCSSRASC